MTSESGAPDSGSWLPPPGDSHGDQGSSQPSDHCSSQPGDQGNSQPGDQGNSQLGGEGNGDAKAAHDSHVDGHDVDMVTGGQSHFDGHAGNVTAEYDSSYGGDGMTEHDSYRPDGDMAAEHDSYYDGQGGDVATGHESSWHDGDMSTEHDSYLGGDGTTEHESYRYDGDMTTEYYGGGVTATHDSGVYHETDVTANESQFSDVGESEFKDWTWQEGTYSEHGFTSGVHTEGIDGYHEHQNQMEDSVGLEQNSVQEGMISQEGCESSSRQQMEVQDSLEEANTANMQESTQNNTLPSETCDLLQEPSTSATDHLTGEDTTADTQSWVDVNNADEEELDFSMALVPYVPPPDSPVSSISTSPSSSPRPHSNLRPGPYGAAAATGVPLHHNPLGAAQARFVRIHPMHVAAAVAAQRCRAAAMMQQQTQMAAAAAMQQQAAAATVHQQAAAQRRAAAATVHQQAAMRHQAAAATVHHQATAQRLATAAQRQAAAVAAAAQQRTHAAMMHQQLVRSRYMGAPVLVRQPFVPAPRVAAPMRVRMRLRRSVMLTEELSLDRP